MNILPLIERPPINVDWLSFTGLGKIALSLLAMIFETILYTVVQQEIGQKSFKSIGFLTFGTRAKDVVFSCLRNELLLKNSRIAFVTVSLIVAQL